MHMHHPNATYDMARLRHAESVSKGERLARAQGFDLGDGRGGITLSPITRLARLVLRRRAVTAPASHGLPATAASARLAPSAR